jgi:hypothetical protein
MTDATLSRLKTPPCRASYPKVFEPEINDQGKKVYSITLLVTDDDEGNAFLAQAEKLADDAGRAKWGDKYATMKKSPTFKRAIRYDVDKYADVVPPVKAFINARSYDAPPGVVSIYAGPDGKPAKITDPSQIYPGAWVKASLHAYATDRPDSKSVSLGLGNVQKWKDGDRIDSRVAAEDEFTADPSAAADLNDL